MVILAERLLLAGHGKGVENMTMPANSLLPFYHLLLVCFCLYSNYGGNMVEMCVSNDK